jgi:IS30 family transposase
VVFDSKISEREILKVQDLLNNRPRDLLGFNTPKQVFAKEVLKEKKYRKMLNII